MAGSTYKVVWNHMQHAWEVYEKTSRGHDLIERYTLKEPAKEHAKDLAESDRGKVKFYSKDPMGKARVVYKRDYK